jgi:hypothetical protein
VLLTVSAALILLLSSSALHAETIPPAILDFAKQAAAGGHIQPLLNYRASTEQLYAFSLHQDDRCGFFVIRVASDNQPLVITADTAIPAGSSPLSSDAWTAFRQRLVETLESDPATIDFVNFHRVINHSLAGFGLGHLRSSATTDILQDLVQGSTVFIDSGHATAGCLLVAPTYFSPSGPIRLGQIVLVGNDRNVYVPVADGQPWRRSETLDAWRSRSERDGPVYGFLFRATQSISSHGPR